MLCISLIVFTAVLITGAVSGIMSYQSTIDSLEQTLTEAVEVAADQVAAEIRSYVNLVQEFANSAVLTDESNLEERLNRLYSLEKNYGFSAVRMVDANGIDLETGEDVSQQDYFKEVKASLKAQVSEPLLTDHSDMLIYINVPCKKTVNSPAWLWEG